MSVQFIVGPAGSGKSEYLTSLIARESDKNRDINYILLVPEQFSSEMQREVIMKCDDNAYMNIDIVGFNRLAYMVFEEQKMVVPKILEDFGKSMMVRYSAGKIKDKLKMYQNSIDKAGFIDEVKSLLSELAMYSIDSTMLDNALKKLSEGDNLSFKLSDISLIMQTFYDEISKSYIVAEEKTKLLSNSIKDSEYIKNSIVVMDSFTGFTPVQLVLVKEIMKYAKDVYISISIDRENYYRKSMEEHELYYLSYSTIQDIKKIINEEGIVLADTVVFDRPEEAGTRYKSPEIAHLEKNIFRFPVNEFTEPVKDKGITISKCRNVKDELRVIAEEIRAGVKNGLRYKDMAVITADLENISSNAEEIFREYDIPYFLDYSRPLSNNPFIDSIFSALTIIEKNYDYESVFYFLKSGVYIEINEDNIDDLEKLENIVLRRGIRGFSSWSKPFRNCPSDEAEEAREAFVKRTEKLYTVFKKDKADVRTCVNAIKEFMESLQFEEKIQARAEELEKAGEIAESKVYEQLYENIIALLDKMADIIPDEILPVHEFAEILRTGMKDISMGIIPPTIDRVVIGDMTRTRLGKVKYLFLMDINEGIIPKNSSGTGIISDRDKEKLKELGVKLAPTDRENSFIDQFYLYLIMSKPSDRLYLLYRSFGRDNVEERPSYVINRILKMFPELCVKEAIPNPVHGTYESDILFLTDRIRRFASGDLRKFEIDETRAMFRAFIEERPEYIDILENAMNESFNDVLNDIAKAIVYGKTESETISRIEQFAACPYSYFMRYILTLGERRTADVDKRNIGNVIHLALKNTFNEVRLDYNSAWDKISDEKLADIMVKHIGAACEDDEFGFSDESGKTEYLKRTLRSLGELTIKTVHKQILSGSMTPKYIEKAFSGDYGLEKAVLHTAKKDISLRGVIDRADIYTDEKNVYVDVIDYKTGNKEFKIEELYEGLSVQLVVYLDVIMELAAREYKDKNVIPTGMYYYHIDDPVVEKEFYDSDEAIKMAIGEKLRYRGVPSAEAEVLNLVEENIEYKTSGEVVPIDRNKNGSLKASVMVANADEFKAMREFANKKLTELTEDILDGNIKKSPVATGFGVKCDSCNYYEVCRFNSASEGKIRRPKYSSKDKARVWNEICGKEEKEEE